MKKSFELNVFNHQEWIIIGPYLAESLIFSCFIFNKSPLSSLVVWSDTKFIFTIFIYYKNGMSSMWVIGNHVRVQGMSNDFKILSYNFIFGGSVEMILESAEGYRFFLKRRKSQISDIEDEYDFDADSNGKNYSY